MFNFFKKINKPKIGYQIKKSNKIHSKKRNKWLSSLFVVSNKKITIGERIVKFLILIALSLVIWDKRWKDKKKKYQIINNVYNSLISNDFAYIPSSLAFYLVIAILPILSIILFATTISFFSLFFTIDEIKPVLGRLIPGLNNFINDLTNVIDSIGLQTDFNSIFWAIFSLLVTSWIASSGFASLIYMQSDIFNHKYYGGYFMNKLKGCFIVIFASFYIILILTTNVKIEKFTNSIEASHSIKVFLSYLFSILTLFFSLFIGFLLLFKYSPRFKIKFKHIISGTITATIPSFIFLAFFGIISSLWNYGKFGALGIFLYLSTSILFISYFLYVGILTNASYYKTFISVKVEKKFTISKK